MRTINTSYFVEYKRLYKLVHEENKKNLDTLNLVKFRFIPLEVFHTDIRNLFNKYLDANITEINSPENYMYISPSDFKKANDLLDKIFGKNKFLIAHSMNKIKKDIPEYNELVSEYPTLEKNGSFKCDVCGHIVDNKLKKIDDIDLKPINNDEYIYDISGYDNKMIKIVINMPKNKTMGIYFMDAYKKPIESVQFDILSTNDRFSTGQINCELKNEYKYLGFYKKGVENEHINRGRFMR